MDSRNPGELITEVKEEQQTRGELATEALQWFLDDNVGGLFPRSGVMGKLSNELDIPKRQANTAISDTVGDIVDPVQQIVKGNKKYVGVIEYKIFNDEGAYGYVDFDDRKGERKRVVCARCVEKHTYDENITHATQGEGSSNPDATWQQLLNEVTSHYADAHTKSPSTIEPGASLVNGTTISGNTAFHAGNESSITVTNTQVGTLADGEFLQNSGGTLAGAAVQGGFSNIDVFETDGTFDASNVDLAHIQVVGGGGGGSTSQSERLPGAGGGGGGYSADYVDLSGTSSVSVTVGSGGSGGADGGNSGSSGESSSFGSFLSATGGAGSNYEFINKMTPGSGGSGSGGSINATGNAGDLGQFDANSTITINKTAGSGGGSFYGGASGETANDSLSPVDGEKYGGGGSGRPTNGSNSAGSGAGGVVVVKH